jgi:nucleotide-binding universal stress UspA family protein
MKKKIIAVIDLNRINHSIIEYSCRIADKYGLGLLLYNVQYTPSPMLTTAGSYSGMGNYYPFRLQEELMSKAEEKMAEITKKVRKRWPSVEYRYEVGFMADSIVDKSRWVLKQVYDTDTFLVVVEKEHEYNWWNELLGTSATRIAEKSPCPVLIIPPEAQYQDIERIMYLVDAPDLQKDQLPNIQWLNNFSQRFDAALALAYLPDEGKELTETELELKMNELRDRMPLRKFFYYQFTPENTSGEMIEIAKISFTDILAFSYQSKSFFHRLFDNDDTRALILKATLPVLVF